MNTSAADRWWMAAVLTVCAAGAALAAAKADRATRCGTETPVCAPEYYAATAATRLGVAVQDEARMAGVSPALALAVCQAESRCEESTGCNSKGACGPMQVVYGVWGDWLGLQSERGLLGLAGARRGVRVLARVAARYRPGDGGQRRCAEHGSDHPWVAHYNDGTSVSPDGVAYAERVITHMAGFSLATRR